MIYRALRIVRIVQLALGLALGLAFLAGSFIGIFSRQMGAAFVAQMPRGDSQCKDEKRSTRGGVKKGILLTLLALGIGGGLVGILVFVSGVVPIKASSRHWPITEWILHFGMERSVATHSIGIEEPPLDDPELVLKGAGHYEIGCRPCHGSPGLTQPLIAHMMTPHPPYLPPRIGKWKPKELFYIVKHGVKFTGMPAWPARHRDDEIWAVVAFLQKLPELDEAGYRRLAYGEPQPAAPIEALEGVKEVPLAALQTCARCHGNDGIARGDGAFPNLAGQSAEYLQNALEAYARGDRHSGMMQPIAAALSADSIRELSQYYSKSPVNVPATPDEAQAAAIERGRSIAQHGIPNQKVPSCVDCHAPETGRPKPEYPVLTGQPLKYLTLQLDLFKKGYRGGSAYAHLMHEVVPRLTEEQMQDVAAYLRTLPAMRTPQEIAPVGP